MVFCLYKLLGTTAITTRKLVEKRKKVRHSLIAVYVNEEGFTASLTEKGYVRMYFKDKNDWYVKREVPFIMGKLMGITEVRASINDMVKMLGECRIFAAKEVVGQLYYMLEASGFDTFEAEGKPEQFLNSIWEAAKTKIVKKTETAKETTPDLYLEQIDIGIYVLDLKKVLKTDCSLTSKKILLPLLRMKNFICLDIICDHVPRWLETELIALELKSTITLLNDSEYKVKITK